MEPTDWIAIAGLATTTVIAAGSLIYASLTQRAQQTREDKLRAAQQAHEDALRTTQQVREDALRERHREDEPHIELSVDCQVHGPDGDAYLFELILTAHNRGLVRQQFRSILLRIRGIERNQPLSQWRGFEPRLEFPVTLINGAEVLPPRYNFLFVEPGVTQTITYTSKIPASMKYILVHVEFRYDKATPHTAERVFQLIDSKP
jgi:hypothetical protein